jgi:hypothetical protein
LILVGFIILNSILAHTSEVQADVKTVTNPNQVKFVTSDVDLFWSAYRKARHGDEVAVFEREYFGYGSIALYDFIPFRIDSPWALVKTVDAQRAYYDAIEPETRRLIAERPAILADFRKLKELYPKAVFPSAVYFVVGRMNTGATSTEDGLIIGAEMNSLPYGFPATSLADNYPIANLRHVDELPPLVTHELAHYQQDYPDTLDLLGSTIGEGSADFIAQLVTGVDPDGFQWTYGCSHELRLWRAFYPQIHNMNAAGEWLYSLNSPLGAPRYIGYWIGYRIVQAYYDATPDKALALDTILHIRDFNKFLKASGYPEHRSACVQERKT